MVHIQTIHTLLFQIGFMGNFDNVSLIGVETRMSNTETIITKVTKSNVSVVFQINSKATLSLSHLW